MTHHLRKRAKKRVAHTRLTKIGESIEERGRKKMIGLITNTELIDVQIDFGNPR